MGDAVQSTVLLSIVASESEGASSQPFPLFLQFDRLSGTHIGGVHASYTPTTMISRKGFFKFILFQVLLYIKVISLPSLLARVPLLKPPRLVFWAHLLPQVSCGVLHGVYHPHIVVV